MLRIVALCANAALLVALLLLVVDDGMPSGGGELFAVLLAFAAPILSILALAFAGSSWLGLYFERKKLEEQKRIADLITELSTRKQ